MLNVNRVIQINSRTRNICEAAKITGDKVTRSGLGLLVTSNKTVTNPVTNSVKHITTYSKYNFFGKLIKTIEKKTIQTKDSFLKLYKINDTKKHKQEKVTLKWALSEDKFCKGSCIVANREKNVSEKVIVGGNLVAEHSGTFLPNGHWFEHAGFNKAGAWESRYEPAVPYGI